MTASVLTHARISPGTDDASTPARARLVANTPRFARAAALLSAALVALGASLGVASPALAHDELVGYDVVTSSSDNSVTGFTLHFSNEIMDIGSEIIATDHHGDDVVDGAPVVSGRDLTQKLLTPLEEGAYEIAWRVVSSDGHPIQGAMIMSVAADGSGEISIAQAGGGESEEDPPHDSDDHSDEGHSHDDEATTEVAATPISAQTGGAQPWWLWAAIGLVAAGVVAAIVAGTVVGQKRRREAFGAAGDASGDTAGENDADETDAR